MNSQNESLENRLLPVSLNIVKYGRKGVTSPPGPILIQSVMVHFRMGCHSPKIPGWIECKSQLCMKKWSKTGSNGLADIPQTRDSAVIAPRIDILCLWPNEMKQDSVKQWDVTKVENPLACGMNHSELAFLKSPKTVWVTSCSTPSPREIVSPASFSLKKMC